MRPSKEKISIIIPSFNRSHVLIDSIESVVNQTCPNWELIIVDDGSTDHTETMVKEYLNDSRVKYLYQPNLGVSSARNKGAKIATGDYIIFLDSDDLFSPGLLENLHRASFFNYDLICWQVRKEVDEEVFIWKPTPLGKLYNGIRATFLAGSICYKKSIFEQAGGYDVKMAYGENYELGLRISQIAELKIKYVDAPLLSYKINTKNRTSNSFSNRLNSHLHQYNKHRDSYEQDSKSKAKMKYIIGYVHEKSGNISDALEWYRGSWAATPWNFKPIIKIIYLKLVK